MNWAHIPSLAALRAFEAAARHLNFSHAAGELNVTHAAVAQHVRALEAQFNESLLIRAGRGLALTEAGKQLADSLNSGFAEIANGVDRLRARSASRPLNITATPAFATNWLMPRMGGFWAKHPEISVSINPSTGIVDMVRDGFDLALRFGEGNWPGVIAEPLTSGDFLVVARPDLIAGRAVDCLSGVADLPWLLEEHMMERRAIVEREGIDFGSVNVTLLNTNGLVISAALSGLGLAVQPRSLVEAEIKSGALTKICEINQPGLGYHMVTLPGREPRGLRQFLNWLRTVAKD